MAQTTTFTNNKIEALKISKDPEFSEDVKKVAVVSVDDTRVIGSTGASWDNWFDSEGMTADFMDERE